MNIDMTFLLSKVAQRIFVLFLSCALFPVLVLTLLYYGHFTKQLTVKTKWQLHQTSKDVGMYIYERLLFLETEMKMVASRINSTQRAAISIPAEELDSNLQQHFKGSVFIKAGGTSYTLFGYIQNMPELTQSETQYIRSGKTVISTSTSYRGIAPRIFMSMVIDPRQPRKGILRAEINPSYLWGISEENSWLSSAELCILDYSNNILFSTLPPPLRFPEEVVLRMNSHVSGQFEWEYKKKHYVAGYWSLFLKPSYYTPKWVVVLSELKADVLSPAGTFKKIFPLVILLTLLVVILVSIVQIRRSLVPLEKLQEGTRHIARRDFDSRVIIKTGDEFEELAASFNKMAARLGKQFKTLNTIAEIDRSILSALDTDKIMAIILNQMHNVLPHDYVSITLFYFDNKDSALTYIREKGDEIRKKDESLLLTSEQIKKIYGNREFFVTKLDHTIPPYLKPLAKRGMKSSIVFPLFINQLLSGIIILGYQKKPSYNQEDFAQARQVADQIAVALSNTRLVEELKQLHLGTLTALARSIDAKSRWTAGHSERVTELALKIGSSLGLSPRELEVLRRGGLLHDIGKIGVPASILDKSGRLTDIEDQFIREHVRWGVHILEPIAAFAEIMPIVLHHHEQFDGTGYPDGLVGEAISLNTRILAVADAFDALTSHRPYRPAESQDQAIESIKQRAGKQFDPQVVRAFLAVMAEAGQK
jgi:putative nucleotidyltransferase with HDIG domain